MIKLRIILAGLLLIVLSGCVNGTKEQKAEDTIVNSRLDTKYYEAVSAPDRIKEQFGPFGPRQQSYTPPKESIFVSPDGDINNDGSTIEKPTTLEKAIKTAKTGNTVVLRGGLYRTGDLVFNTQITIQPYLTEHPVLKGSKVAIDWVKKGENWAVKFDTLLKGDLPKWFKPDRHKSPALYYKDLVIFDSNMLIPVDSLKKLEKGKFYCDYDSNEVFISEDPTDKLVEIAAYEYGLVRKHDATADKQGPTILGLDIMHYGESCIIIEGEVPLKTIEAGAYFDAPVQSRIEDCRILFTSRTGLRVSSPDSYFGYNDISMHGNNGMAIHMSHNAVFEHNDMHKINNYGLVAFPAGLKVFNQAQNFRVQNNYISDMSCVAVWYDVGLRDGVIIKNYISKAPVGIKIEISHKMTIAGNVFNKSRVWLCNSANGLVYNNTFIDGRIDLWRNNRGNRGGYNKNFTFDHASAGPGAWGYHGHEVVNNVFSGSQPNDDIYMLIEGNNDFDKNFQSQKFESNLFLSEAKWTFNVQFRPWEMNEPKNYISLADFKTVFGEFEKENTQLSITKDELFESAENGIYNLKDFSGRPKGALIPNTISEYLGWKKNNTGLGAFAE